MVWYVLLVWTLNRTKNVTKRKCYVTRQVLGHLIRSCISRPGSWAESWSDFKRSDWLKTIKSHKKPVAWLKFEMEDPMKANSSARAVNKFRLASTIIAIPTVKTVVAQAIIAIEMELLVQTIMSHQECNSNSSFLSYFRFDLWYLKFWVSIIIH